MKNLLLCIKENVCASNQKHEEAWKVKFEHVKKIVYPGILI